jgi:hypothetical protein
MKLLVTALVLASALLFAGSASAYHTPAGTIHGDVVIPPEWAGIWQTSDSTYDCNGVLQGVSSGVDTLCAGTRFDTTSTISCTGSATSTTFNQHCTGSGEVFTDCNYTIDVLTHGTRSGDTFFSVSVFQSTYAGTGKGCDFFPDQCQQINTHSTRTGPAPAAYCASPAAPTSWGKVKASYR